MQSGWGCVNTLECAGKFGVGSRRELSYKRRGMNEWWLSLTEASRVFWGIALAASLFQVLVFLGSLVSGHELDHSTDSEGSGTDHGIKILSVRAVVAFFVGFGWAGVLFLTDGRSLAVVTAIALFAGMIFMAVIFLIMRFLMALRANGTMDYANAVGQSGHVYVTIPARHAGPGQVEIMIQGRLTTALAVTEYSESLAPQTPILVESIEGQTLLVVSPVF